MKRRVFFTAGRSPKRALYSRRLHPRDIFYLAEERFFKEEQYCNVNRRRDQDVANNIQTRHGKHHRHDCHREPRTEDASKPRKHAERIQSLHRVPQIGIAQHLRDERGERGAGDAPARDKDDVEEHVAHAGDSGGDDQILLVVVREDAGGNDASGVIEREIEHEHRECKSARDVSNTEHKPHNLGAEDDAADGERYGNEKYERQRALQDRPKAFVIFFCQPRHERHGAHLDDPRYQVQHLDDADGSGINTDFRSAAHPADDEDVGVGEQYPERAGDGERPCGFDDRHHALRGHPGKYIFKSRAQKPYRRGSTDGGADDVGVGEG